MVGLVLPNCDWITAVLLATAEIRSHEGNRHVYETSMIDEDHVLKAQVINYLKRIDNY